MISVLTAAVQYTVLINIPGNKIYKVNSFPKSSTDAFSQRASGIWISWLSEVLIWLNIIVLVTIAEFFGDSCLSDITNFPGQKIIKNSVFFSNFLFNGNSNSQVGFCNLIKKAKDQMNHLWVAEAAENCAYFLNLNPSICSHLKIAGASVQTWAKASNSVRTIKFRSDA